MSLAFRNVDADPSAPVRDWPYEALVAAIERGTVGTWALIAREVRRAPYGGVARSLEDYLADARSDGVVDDPADARPDGVAALLERAIHRARESARARERWAVAEEVARLVAESGLGVEGFARAIGTSRSRLSTYRSGHVMPSAALMVRMRNVVSSAAGGDLPPRSGRS